LDENDGKMFRPSC